MKKSSTETEPTWVQSFNGASHTPKHTTLSPPFPQTTPGEDTNPVFFKPILILLLPVQSIHAEFLNHCKKRFLLVWSSLNYFPVHQPAATNSLHLQSTYTPHLQPIQSEASLKSSRTSAVELFCGNSQRIKAVGYLRRRAPSWMFDRILNATLPTNYFHLHQKLTTLPGMFGEIPRNVWRDSEECLRTLSGMFDDIPQNVWWYSQECLMTFPGIFRDIPRNVWRRSPEWLRTFPWRFDKHSPDYLATFRGILGDIPRNVWRQSPKCLATFPGM